jgi:hypothetical protein
MQVPAPYEVRAGQGGVEGGGAGSDGHVDGAGEQQGATFSGLCTLGSTSRSSARPANSSIRPGAACSASRLDAATRSGRRPEPACRTSRIVRSRSPSSSAARLASRSPPGVNASPLAVRAKSLSPSSPRRCARWMETADSDTAGSAAAAFTDRGGRSRRRPVIVPRSTRTSRTRHGCPFTCAVDLKSAHLFTKSHGRVESREDTGKAQAGEFSAAPKPVHRKGVDVHTPACEGLDLAQPDAPPTAKNLELACHNRHPPPQTRQEPRSPGAAPGASAVPPSSPSSVRWPSWSGRRRPPRPPY